MDAPLVTSGSSDAPCHFSSTDHARAVGLTARFQIPKRKNNIPIHMSISHSIHDPPCTTTTTTLLPAQDNKSHNNTLQLQSSYHSTIENFRIIEHRFDASNTQQAILGLVPGTLPTKVYM